MRNLKRALSLGLTAAMISGLMVMGSSAVGYADVTSEQNQEAIEVLQAVGIMTGVDDQGNFDPDGTVTRNQMAVIMANLMEYNVANFRDTSPFTDVPSWAEPYVAACYTNGITSGYSDTIYGGNDSVTTAQAALMLMKALGYFQYASDFGQEWQLATLKQGNNIDLFVGVDSRAEDPLTRNDVAQLVLNTLKSGTVEASTDGSLEIGGVVINSNVSYSYITSNQSYATAIDDARSTSNNSDAQRSIVELGEQLYMGNLKLNNNAIDEFGRPSRTWNYDGAEVGTYAKAELLKATYTEAVTGREMYDLLTASTINENDVLRYVDGQGVDGKAIEMDKKLLARNNKDDLPGTGNGVLTEVYLDDDNDEVTIASINTYLAQGVGDYSEGKEYAPLEVYMDLTGGSLDTHVYNVDVDDVPAIADVVDEGFYLVNISYANDSVNGEITDVSDVEIMENSTVTKWSDSTSKVLSKLTVDGTEYKASEKAFYDDDTLDAYDNDLLTDVTYNLYLDSYGYVIGVDVYEGDLKYVFITGYDRNSSNLSVSTATAAGIFLDGTMEEIKVNVKDTNENIAALDGPDVDTLPDDPYYREWTPGTTDGDPTLNRWYKYSVNESGVYTLKPVSMTATLYKDLMADGTYEDVTINTANVSVREDATLKQSGASVKTTRVYGEDESVYITVDTDLVDTVTKEIAITDVDGVFTGVQSIDLEVDTDKTTLDNNIEAQVYTVYDKNNYVIGAIVLGEASGTGDYAYIVSDGATSEERLADGTYLWEFDAILDGELQTLTAKSKYTAIINTIEANRWKGLELSFDGDGYVIRAEVPEADKIYDYSDAIDEEIDIDDFDLYFIDTDKKMQLNLQGRTLYITPDQKDMGLALAADAKAVVIQTENGQSNVKTEFTTVKSAISHLADADPDTTALDYEGEIFAVLNSNGSGAWIVFKSDTPLVTGDGGIHVGGGNSITNGNVALVSRDDNLKVEGVSINYNFLWSSINYSFTVVDDKGNAIPGATVNYDLKISVNNQVVQDTTDSGTANTSGVVYEVYGGFGGGVAATASDYVVVEISNVHVTMPAGYKYVDADDSLNLTFRDGAGNAVTPRMVDGRYYVPSGTRAISDKQFTYGSADVTTTDRIAANAVYTVSTDTTMREVVTVTLNNVTATAADGSSASSTTAYVVDGTELTLSGTGSGYIEGTSVGELAAWTEKVIAAEDVTYSNAYSVSLGEDLSATVNGQRVNDGDGVVAGATMDVYVQSSDVDVKLVSGSAGDLHGSAQTPVGGKTNDYQVTVNAAQNLFAGVEVSFTGVRVYYNNYSKEISSADYVCVGTELIVVGTDADPITVTAGGTPVSTTLIQSGPARTVSFVVDTEEVSITQ